MRERYSIVFNAATWDSPKQTSQVHPAAGCAPPQASTTARGSATHRDLGIWRKHQVLRAWLKKQTLRIPIYD